MERETISKLGLNNYFAWSCQTEAVLDSRDLWNAVSEGWTEEELADVSNEEKKQNKLALAFIKRAVEDNHLEYIGQCKSAKEAWDILKAQFCERDEFQQLVMMKQLLRMEKDDKTTVMEYMNKVTSAHRELATTGLIEFSDRTLALVVLMGLPEEYSDCVRSLTRDKKLSVRYIMPVLRAEEARIKMSKEDRRINQELKGYMYKKQQPKFVANSNNLNNPKPNFECFVCHKPGHAAKNCAKVLSAKARGTILCYSCGEEGHMSTMCSKSSENMHCKANNRQSSSDSKRNGQKFRSNEAKVEVSEQDEGEDQVKIGNNVVRVKYRALIGTVMGKQTENDGMCSDPNRWCLDSGCNAHCTPFRELLENFKPASGSMEVAKQKQMCEAKGVGTVTMKLKDDFGGWTLQLQEVYFVPEASDNLISVRQMDKKGIKFTIENGCFRAFDKTTGEDQELFNAVAVKNDLYVFQVDWYEQKKSSVESACKQVTFQSGTAIPESTVTLTARKAVTKEIWHHRFGHANNLPDSNVIPRGKCEDCYVCFKGKAKKLPFPEREKKSEEVLDLVYSDVCFVQPNTKGEGNCFITFSDDFSRYSEVSVLRSKAEAFDAFTDFKNKSENFQQRNMKAFQTDNGREYVNSNFKNLLKQCGIITRFSMAGAHQQMGVSERLNQQLLTMARCMLIHSGLPDNFWGEAIKTACYIKNRCKSKAINDQVPIELWTKKPLSDKELKEMVVFGCQSWVLVEDNIKSQKMEPKAIECVMLGYPQDKRGYRLWDMNKECIVLSRNVRFCETTFPMKKIVRNVNVDPKCSVEEVEIGDLGQWSESEEIDDSNEEDNYHNSVQSEENLFENSDQESMHKKERREEEDNSELRRTTRKRQKKECFCCKSTKLENNCEFCDPRTVNEALKGNQKGRWIKAMEEEMLNLKKNQTWELMQKPPQSKVINCKWVFKTKRDQEGKIVTFKARLVAIGYSQVPGIDYKDTFSPVVNRKVIRLMVALMVENDWDCRHVDVKSAYLNSEIKEDIYMKQPEGFVTEEHPDFVCKLKKSMYGLKQAGRDWNLHLHKILTDLGLKESISDPCLYFHITKRMFVTVYVDDLGIWGELQLVNIFVNLLKQKLQIRDLGFITNFLNIKFDKESSGDVRMNQKMYIESVLDEYGLNDCKGVKTTLSMPMKDKNKPKIVQEELCDRTTYRRIVGSVRHISNVSRLDISYSVCKLSQKFENPTVSDLKEAKHLLKYLKTTKNLSVYYRKTGEPVKVYVDASWGREKEEKSVTGYVILLAGSPVIWKSVVQKRVAANNNESEIIAMVDVLHEVQWLDIFLKDVGQSKFMDKPCVIFGDNRGGILISKGEGISDRTRHCAAETSALRESVNNGFVVFEYVPTEENAADLLTKTLSSVLTNKFCIMLGFVNVDAFFK